MHPRYSYLGTEDRKRKLESIRRRRRRRRQTSLSVSDHNPIRNLDINPITSLSLSHSLNLIIDRNHTRNVVAYEAFPSVSPSQHHCTHPQPSETHARTSGHAQDGYSRLHGSIASTHDRQPWGALSRSLSVESPPRSTATTS